MDVGYRPQMRPPGRPTGEDLRTPVAWRQREQNFHHSQRPPSPVSTTTDDTSSEVETSVSGRRYNRLQSAAAAANHEYSGRSNTIRSTRSVPALNLASTWDGEPCPIHGGHLMHPHAGGSGFHHIHPAYAHHVGPYLPGHPTHRRAGNMKRAGSMFDMRMVGALPPSYYSPPIPAPSLYSPHPMPGYLTPTHGFGRTLEKKSHYGSLRSLHSLPLGNGGPFHLPPPPPPYHLPPMPPPHLLPPGMRPRPLVIPAGAEPLPVRDPAKVKMAGGVVGLSGSAKAASSHGAAAAAARKRRYHCCRGPLPLVWFIITIVTVGVVLGVILGSIYG